MNKYWGTISTDKIKQVFTDIPAKVKKTEQYGTEIVVDAITFDDGNIAISVYNKETQERIHIGKLLVSKFKN